MMGDEECKLDSFRNRGWKVVSGGYELAKSRNNDDPSLRSCHGYY